MEHSRIKVITTVNAKKQKVWNYYTNPEHITNWNFADPSWHCPKAINQLHVGGKYFARMEAKDGSYGFDFEAEYLEINEETSFMYEFGERIAIVLSEEIKDKTIVTIEFDPEKENTIELQKQGWQAILNNFKLYTENN